MLRHFYSPCGMLVLSFVTAEEKRRQNGQVKERRNITRKDDKGVKHTTTSTNIHTVLRECY